MNTTNNILGFNQNQWNINQIIITILFGYLGAFIQSKKSNIPPLLAAAILGTFISKSIYGDWDLGYQWSISDIFFLLASICESLIGGIIFLILKKKKIL